MSIDQEQRLRALVEKWRDRANEEEYKLHREWAIDQCADELEQALAATEGTPPLPETDDWELACPMCGKKECCGLACQGTQPPAAEHCHANRDGECDHKNCPQLRDGEPKKSGRSCPLPQ